MKIKLLKNQELSHRDRQSMYNLLKTHFEGIKLEVFTQDLREKNWVLLLKDEHSEELKGFSTFLIYQTEFAGEVINIVYSGDTIIDPSAWSSLALPRGWIAAIKYVHQTFNEGKLYWLLISSGYRTYRFLPTFWQDFYPRYDVGTPEKMLALKNFLAQSHFKDYYNAKTGIVRFSEPQILKEGLRGVPENRLSDPHIRFFVEQNPGHFQGDELVCLTEISPENLTPAGKRMWFSNTILNLGGA